MFRRAAQATNIADACLAAVSLSLSGNVSAPAPWPYGASAYEQAPGVVRGREHNGSEQLVSGARPDEPAASGRGVVMGRRRLRAAAGCRAFPTLRAVRSS